MSSSSTKENPYSGADISQDDPFQIYNSPALLTNATTVPEDLISVAPGVFEYILPQSKRTVHFKLLSVNDDKNITKELEANKKASRLNDGIDKELTTRLKAAIISVDGNADRKFVSDFVDNQLFAMDSRALRTYMRDCSPDVLFEVPFTCTECGHEEEALGFTIDTNFFWPKS